MVDTSNPPQAVVFYTVTTKYDDMVLYVCTTQKIQGATFTKNFEKEIFTSELNILSVEKFYIRQNILRKGFSLWNMTQKIQGVTFAKFFEKGFFYFGLNILSVEKFYIHQNFLRKGFSLRN